MTSTMHNRVQVLARQRYAIRRRGAKGNGPLSRITTIESHGQRDVVVTDGGDHIAIERSEARTPSIYDFQRIREELLKRRAETVVGVVDELADEQPAEIDAEAHERYLDWCFNCCWRQ